MRYSLGWLFTAMAYVALVTGTIVSANSFLNSLIWTATAIAFCYAAVTLCFARGRRKAVALGFVLLSSAHFAVLCYFPARTPAAQLFTAIGYLATEQGYLFARSDPPIVQVFSADRIGRDRLIVDGQSALSAANAVGAMLAGLIGCGIGALAYRHSHEP